MLMLLVLLLMVLLTGNSAMAQATFDETQTGCWPGAGYCSDGATQWKLEKVKAQNGKPSVQLSINGRVSTYQDTNGWKDEEKWRVTYEVSAEYQVQSYCHSSCRAVGF
jgi:hypothetical protein